MMMKNNNQRNSLKEFILNYRAALKAKLSREQFSELLKIKPDSLRRRRLSVLREVGLDLPQLDFGNNTLDQDKLDKFNQALLDLSPKDEDSKISFDKNKQIYVITSAQNATPVHEGFLASILNYCQERNAQLLVIPYRYKNPTSIWTQNNEADEWWHSSIKSYLCNEDLRLAKKLRIMGHIPIRPTASNPVNGFDGHTGLDSAIFGHPKIQLKTISTPSQSLPKIMATTGTCTISNYTNSKAGHHSDFHHSLAAVVVEIDDDIFHIRHIHGDEISGEFYDLNYHYSPDAISVVERCAALISGDIHAEFIDQKVLNATYLNKDSIVSVLNPESMVFHDLVDFYSRNHHHKGNDVISIGKHRYGRDNVEEGLQCGADFVDSVSRPDITNVIVPSNHLDAFDRWLKEADPKNDPENAQFFYYMKYNQCKNIKMTETGFSSINPFEFWCKNPETQKGLQNLDNTKFLKRGDSYPVAGIELGFHGDMGPNGAYGSIQSFSKIGPKCVIGHSHCLTDNHSVLEYDKGWINVSEVAIGDRVLSLNNGTNEYVNVDKTFNFLHNGFILTIGGKLWRQEVTEQHNMFLNDGSYKPVCEVVLTEEISKIPITGKSIINNSNNIEIDKNIISKIVAVCADGNIQDGKWIRFHIKKSRKLDRLKKLFGNDIKDPTIGFNGASKVTLITGSESYKELKRYMNFDIEWKQLPNIFKNLTVELKQHLIDELTYWAGTYKKDTSENGFQWSTTKKTESDLISGILTELGYRNSCKFKWKKPSKNYGGLFVVSWCEDRNHIFYSEKSQCNKARLEKWGLFSEKVENKPVFCLSNKNKNFWVRNNTTGQVSLTGNSPGIFEGAYQVGVSAKLDLEYVKGQPSSWLHTHCIIYPDGKRTLINVIEGRWKL